ncbi:MAG: GatB/YqeY domain-containing protein [Rhizorhabdus sp.]|uniref:GatB/YqeY domain-containing protein n=1 Tax=Rhizorhabdus sp. TaxID=1968843 RepID=UPI001B497081|nr:GatB/YqeY domain-containing protein [Rhizorhabdus sp.]MBP8234268.1 GatB/YqeY domain-containing protein [Rhizorhabdus sp.]
MIRDDIKAALVVAMKARDTTTTAAIRLIQSTIKNRDIELRTAAALPDDDLLITEVLQKMIKQRRESIEMYEKGNRPELAAAEAAEVEVIERFLPRQMSDDEARAAIDALATELDASSVKDMGRVMAALKERFAGQMDMGKASGLVKARLAG